MTGKRLFHLVSIAAVAVLIGVVSCDEREVGTLGPATFPTDADIFLNGFGPGVDFQAFGDSKVDALNIDPDVTYDGSRSMRFTVPSVGDPSGFFAGGAFVHNSGRDLTGYEALTFWAKASMVATLGVAGFGNDNTGTSQFVAVMTDLPLTTSWQYYVIPIPFAEKLTREQGLFQLAAGAQNGNGYDVWFDEVKFDNTGLVAHPRPSIQTQVANLQIGDTLIVAGTDVVFNIAGTDQTVHASVGYFTFASSDESVAIVGTSGVVQVVGEGTSIITARLGDVDATGTVTINVGSGGGVPTMTAPTPTEPSASVISLFSNAYTNVTVDSWSADWDDAGVKDVQISGDDVKLYTNLTFAGIEFLSQEVDASTMTHFHMDIWTPDPTAAPAEFRIKLVNDVFGNLSEDELTFTDPPLSTGQWVSLDIPLSDFSMLASTANLGQLIISGDPNTVYVDNIYFYSGGSPSEPSVPAPTPTFPEEDVVSLFSNAYADVPVGTWSADWDGADVADVQVAGNDVKLYTNLVFAGIEFLSPEVDATSMTHFHMDIWTPDPAAAAEFRIKLVNDVFGSLSEHELVFTDGSSPPLATGQWVSFDIPFTDFVNLLGRGQLGQLIISGDPNTVYVDNIFFHR